MGVSLGCVWMSSEIVRLCVDAFYESTVVCGCPLYDVGCMRVAK